MRTLGDRHVGEPLSDLLVGLRPFLLEHRRQRRAQLLWLS
jgi:hypothetical protein